MQYFAAKITIRLWTHYSRRTREILHRFVDGFEPVHDLPASRLNARHRPEPRPKKPHSEHRDGQRSGEAARGHKPAGSKPAGTGRPTGARNKPRRGGPASSGNRTGDARPAPKSR